MLGVVLIVFLSTLFLSSVSAAREDPLAVFPQRALTIESLLARMGILETAVVQQERCSTADDVIMRLQSPTDAYGEVWNGASNYPIEICFSKIFPGYNRPPNPHACKPGAVPSNRVVQLNDATNALANGGKAA